ncbi:MAG: ABC transporter ATP-binding protein [Phycisphaeraceae bacterium]
MIHFHEVTKSYPGAAAPAVDRLSLEVAAGELLVLLGESGCGKTTTLKMINRLIEPTAGRITLEQRNVRALKPVTLRRQIGYVFQGIGLFPHMSVAENIAIVPRLLGWPRKQVAARVDELLALVNLPAETFRARWPAALSGGQQQRVGVARALAARPRIMLMDEPFGALDPITRDTLQQEYLRLHRELELTTVMVTHDMTEALLLADRIAVMQAGRIVALETPPTLLNNPLHPYVEVLMQSPSRQVQRLEALARGGNADE